MLAFEMAIVARLLCRITGTSSSSPTRNMKKMMPPWAWMRSSGTTDGGRQRREDVGRHPAEQRRAQQDAANQFADDRRLLDPLKQVADDTRCGDDGGDCHQQMKGDHHFNGIQRVDYAPKLMSP